LSRAELSGIAALFKACRHFAGGELRLALALMVLGAVEEGFGLLMIVPLAAAILDEATARVGPREGNAADRAVEGNQATIGRVGGGSSRFDASPLRFDRRHPTWDLPASRDTFAGGMISAPVHLFWGR
jgi:hypothetical protein